MPFSVFDLRFRSAFSISHKIGTYLFIYFPFFSVYFSFFPFFFLSSSFGNGDPGIVVYALKDELYY